ncbi:hypothetical protein PYW07_000511 [Mythimna separata]|uniref:glutamine synthetase n=1 Tax=Mythimna separata TaxID=271217 RepID=A0AAD7Z3S4_MYTSE|nr:hypothetical protein PYW07_000511 [Mythimna separata]
MLSACVVVDHRPRRRGSHPHGIDDVAKDENTIRGNLSDNPQERFIDLPLPENQIMATYVWIDGTGERLRYKDRTLDYIPLKPKGKFTLMMENWDKKVMETMLSKITYTKSAMYLPPYDYYPRNLENFFQAECKLRPKRNINVFDENLKDLPIISYDGFGTQQAIQTDSDLYLCPRAIYRNPFRNGNHLLVMCDTYDKNLDPTPTNHRVKCADAYKKCHEDEPWFGIEQEYFFLNKSDSRPLGWPKGGFPRRSDQYYCGIGSDKFAGRDIVLAHYRCCLFAGIPVYGTNAEIGPSQWEYQVGPSVGLHAGDDVWMARFVMEMLASEYGVQVTWDPKPFEAWEGSGAHTNFSTKQMRAENGIEHIEKAIYKLRNVHEKHIEAYDPHGGKDNERRLIGTHQTERICTFSAGVAERFCSIRIPRIVAEQKRGFFEDRRPASNVDPYRAIDALMRTCLLNEY